MTKYKIFFAFIILIIYTGCDNNTTENNNTTEPFSYITVPATRNSVIEGNMYSETAKSLVPISGTVAKEINDDRTYLMILAEFQYNGTDSEPDHIGFPQGRTYLTFEDKTELVNSDDAVNGFVYMHIPYASRYQSNGEYYYGSYHVLKGDTVYLGITIDITYEDHKFNNIDLDSIKSIEFDLIAETFENLTQEFIDNTIGLKKENKSIVDNIATISLTNLSSSITWKNNAFIRPFFFKDSSDNLVYFDFCKDYADTKLDVEPSGSIQFSYELPSYVGKYADSFIYINKYEE